MNFFLSSMWDRLTDRTRWPRSWCWPLPVTASVSDEELRKQHDQTSTTINNLLLTLLALCFFCWLALGGLPPDISDQRVTLPFANVQVDLISFLIIGPLLLMAFSIYLQ